MNTLTRICAGAAVVGGMALPAAAQNYQYPQAYQQQGYGQQGGIAGIIGQLLGNRNTGGQDRMAISQCAAAAQQQATAQYRPRYNQGYGNPYGGGYAQQQYQGQQMARVTAITNVERRRSGLRVTGMLDSGMGHSSQYGYSQPGYGQQGYGQGYGNAYGQAGGDLMFRCTVDYRGVVTNLRVTRAGQQMYRR